MSNSIFWCISVWSNSGWLLILKVRVCTKTIPSPTNISQKQAATTALKCILIRMNLFCWCFYPERIKTPGLRSVTQIQLKNLEADASAPTYLAEWPQVLHEQTIRRQRKTLLLVYGHKSFYGFLLRNTKYTFPAGLQYLIHVQCILVCIVNSVLLLYPPTYKVAVETINILGN